MSRKINEKLLAKWINEIFSSNKGQRYITVSDDFFPTYRKEFGDEGLYALLTSLRFIVSDNAKKYALEFITEYEKSDAYLTRTCCPDSGKQA